MYPYRGSTSPAKKQNKTRDPAASFIHVLTLYDDTTNSSISGANFYRAGPFLLSFFVNTVFPVEDHVRFYFDRFFSTAEQPVNPIAGARKVKQEAAHTEKSLLFHNMVSRNIWRKEEKGRKKLYTTDEIAKAGGVIKFFFESYANHVSWEEDFKLETASSKTSTYAEDTYGFLVLMERHFRPVLLRSVGLEPKFATFITGLLNLSPIGEHGELITDQKYALPLTVGINSVVDLTNAVRKLKLGPNDVLQPITKKGWVEQDEARVPKGKKAKNGPVFGWTPIQTMLGGLQSAFTRGIVVLDDEDDRQEAITNFNTYSEVRSLRYSASRSRLIREGFAVTRSSDHGLRLEQASPHPSRAASQDGLRPRRRAHPQAQQHRGVGYSRRRGRRVHQEPGLGHVEPRRFQAARQSQRKGKGQSQSRRCTSSS